MVQTIDDHTFGDIFGILSLIELEIAPKRNLRQRKSFTYNFLDHVHDLLLDKVQALSITSRSPADDIVDLDIIIFLAHAATVHGVGELNKHRVLLHDALNVLATNADNTFVVLIGDMERDRSRHFLLNEVETILGRVVLIATNINVEVVLIESIEDDLNIACSHVSNAVKQF